MKKLCLVFLMTFLLSGCSNKKDTAKAYEAYTFQATSERYLITVTESEILVSDRTGVLSYPVRYSFSDGILSYETLTYSYSPLPSSVLQVGLLLREALANRTKDGIFSGEPFTIEYSRSGEPLSLVWGAYHFTFI